MKFNSPTFAARVRAWLHLAGAVVVASLTVPLGSAQPAAAIDPRTLIEPATPAWITAPLQPDLKSAPPPAVAAAPESNNPLRVLVFEEQYHVGLAEGFMHSAIRIESEAGLQQAGQVSVDFAPAYQRLRWHALRIWRDGVARDALEPARLQVINREQDAERFLYHGRLTAHIVLRDLRVGDVVESLYTIAGENPVFGGKFSSTYGGAFSLPVEQLLYRVVTPRDRPLRLNAVGAFALGYRVSESAGETEHLWRGARLKEIRAVSDAPQHTLQVPFLQVSEFSDWAEVAAWGSRLFEVGGELSPAVRARVDELTRDGPTIDAKAEALTRFVQDEIRYLGVHLNESTHRPALPDEVLGRRYGDCKDKSLLLVTLLRALGLNAHVALVNSSLLRGVNQLGPAPLSFDHAIVRVELPIAGTPTSGASARNDTRSSRSGPGRAAVLWLDATMTLQGGALRDRFTPAYGEALVLGTDAQELERIPFFAASAGGSITAETYTVTDYTGAASLLVARTYTGAVADGLRYWRRFADQQQATQQLTGLLARLYPKITAEGATEWTDDRDANVLTARTRFSVPDFWTVDSEGKHRIAEVYPWAFTERLPRPETTERTLPFGLPFPQDIRHTIELNLPKDWPTYAEKKSINDATFRYDYEVAGKGARVNVSHHWRSTADEVPAERITDWIKRMADVRATFGYQVQQNIRLAALMKETGVVASIWLLIVGGALAGLAGGVWLYRWRPASADSPPPIAQPELTGIGGWLVVLAIGVVTRPLFIVPTLRDLVVLAGERPNWTAATDPESVSFIEGYRAIVWCEAFFAALLFTWALVMILQFFRRRASLPVSLIAFLVSVVVWSTVDTIWAGRLRAGADSDPAGSVALVRLYVYGVIWISYLLVSKRVRHTFRR